MNKIIWLWALVLTVVLVACSGGDENEQDSESENEETTEEQDTEETNESEEASAESKEPTEPEFTYPLTGEEAEEEINQRALAVMINNHPDARPQSGLKDADVVYEYLAEGYITRLLALYQSELPEQVGPVRSARSYYIETAKAHDAIYVYHGAANFIEEEIRNGWVDHLNGALHDDDKHLFERSPDRVAPHNSYVFLNNAYGVASNKGLEVEMEHEGYDFKSVNDDESMKGKTADSVTIDYSSNRSVSYEYDESEDGYVRSSDGSQNSDLVTGDPIVPENVLIYETSHEVIDDVGRREIDIQSGGQGYALQQGKLKEIEWETVNDVMTPMVDGEPLELLPGQTWVNVVPKSPGLTESVTYE